MKNDVKIFLGRERGEQGCWNAEELPAGSKIGNVKPEAEISGYFQDWRVGDKERETAFLVSGT